MKYGMEKEKISKLNTLTTDIWDCLDGEATELEEESKVCERD